MPLFACEPCLVVHTYSIVGYTMCHLTSLGGLSRPSPTDSRAEQITVRTTAAAARHRGHHHHDAEHDHAHAPAFAWPAALRIGLVALAAPAVWGRVWEPCPAV